MSDEVCEQFRRLKITVSGPTNELNDFHSFFSDLTAKSCPGIYYSVHSDSESSDDESEDPEEFTNLYQ